MKATKSKRANQGFAQDQRHPVDNEVNLPIEVLMRPVAARSRRLDRLIAQVKKLAEKKSTPPRGRYESR